MSTTLQPPLTTEVNNILDTLIEHDDFNMTHGNCRADILDADNDLGILYIDNNVVSMYRYGGKYVWPFYTDEKLIKEMQIVLNIA